MYKTRIFYSNIEEWARCDTDPGECFQTFQQRVYQEKLRSLRSLRYFVRGTENAERKRIAINIYSIR